MSMATRCTACGTVFRVVQDQLKVSEGWVRCGRCDEVFNAADDVFELRPDASLSQAAAFDDAGAAEAHAADLDVGVDVDVDAAAPAAANARIVPADGMFDASDLPLALAADASDPQLVDRIDAALFPSRTGRGAATAGNGRAGAVPADDAAAAPPSPADANRFARRSVDRPGDPAGTPSRQPGGAAAAGDDAPLESLMAGTPGAEPAGRPTFVRDAERAASWRTSGARLRLALAVLALAALLGGQVVHHHRDVVAAAVPALRPVLAAWCGGVGCRLDAPRRIEDFSVESTALTRVPDGEAFRLAVGLRNRGRLALTLPSIELSLTDGNGELVARRALAAADFRAASPSLAPGADALLQLLLSIGTPRVSGYTVEIFYP